MKHDTRLTHKLRVIMEVALDFWQEQGVLCDSSFFSWMEFVIVVYG